MIEVPKALGTFDIRWQVIPQNFGSHQLKNIKPLFKIPIETAEN